MYFTIHYYKNVEEHDETTPCKIHPRMYSTLDEAKIGAMKAMPIVERQFGKKAGYVIFSNLGDVVEIGPDNP